MSPLGSSGRSRPTTYQRVCTHTLDIVKKTPTGSMTSVLFCVCVWGGGGGGGRVLGLIGWLWE